MEVSSQGYYKWLNKLNKPDKDSRISELIKSIFEDHKRRYGSRRIKIELAKKGFTVNIKKILRLMKKKAMVTIQRAKKRRKRSSLTLKEAEENLLKQDFSADAPNEKWVSDITYIKIAGRQRYLSVIIDCFNREVVAWEFNKYMGASIITKPLEKALRRKSAGEGLIFHSDRGTQYDSSDLKLMLKSNDIKQSMSGKASCYDNAVAESFFKTLKTELIFKEFKDEKEAEMELFKYIEMYYNTKRMHSANNYLAPMEKYNLYLKH